MSRTSLTSLEVLLAVETHGSIGGAARALGLAQPTVSAGLRGLERSLGVQLVRRTARGSTLTEAGVKAAELARDVLAASDRFEQSMAGASGRGSGRLVVAASMTVAENLMPSWLARWQRELTNRRVQRPSVELLVRNSVGVMRAVLDRDAEIGYIEGGDVLPGLTAVTVGVDELVAVVGPTHPWADGQVAAAPDQLATAGLVLREKGSGTREVLERALAAVGAVLPHDLPQLGSTSAIKSALAEGDSVGVISMRAVGGELRLGTLVRVPLVGLDLRREFRAVRRARDDLGAAARELLAVSVRSEGGSR